MFRNKDNMVRSVRKTCADLVVGLDVGTTKICTIVSAKTPVGMEILAVGSSVSKGLKKGIVVDIEEATKSIIASIRDAEEGIRKIRGFSGYPAEDRERIRIDSVYVGIAGGHIKSFNGYGVIGIRERKISEKDIERLMDTASASYVPIDREVLQIIPSGFSIDGSNGITDPSGKKGKVLEARVHIVTGAIAPVQNLIRCCEAAGVKVTDIILEPVASAEAVLSSREMEVGTLMIDLGGGTTDIALFKDGQLRHTASIAVGGNHITNDIATGLNLSVEEAEMVKKAYGLIGPDQILSEIVYLRCEELFSLIKKEVAAFSGYKNKETLPHYIKSVVLTGGTSLLKGIDRVAEDVFGRPTRIGIPGVVIEDDLKNPIYSTGIGLVRFGWRLRDARTRPIRIGGHHLKVSSESERLCSSKSKDLTEASPVRNSSRAVWAHPMVFDRMKEWVKGFLK